MKVAHISIKYDEGDPATYAGVEYRVDRGKHMYCINTGNPTADYAAAMMVLYTVNGDEAIIMGSSSIDHFVMDGGDLETENFSEEQLVQAKKSIQTELSANFVYVRGPAKVSQDQQVKDN